VTGEVSESALRWTCLPSKAEVRIQSRATRATRAAMTPAIHRPRPLCGINPLIEVLSAMVLS